VFVQQVKHIFASQGLILIKEATETRFPNCQVGVTTSNVLLSHNDLVNRYGISVSQMPTWYVPFVVITIRSCPHEILPDCNKSDTNGATSGTGTAYLSGAPEFTPGFIVGFAFANLSFLFPNWILRTLIKCLFWKC